MTPYDDIPLEVRRLNWGWFGEPWPSGICYRQDPETGMDVLPHEWEWTMHVPTPIGTRCWYCDEVIVDGDQGQLMPKIGLNRQAKVGAQHRECALAAVVGPPPNHRNDESIRQTALEVWDHYLSFGVTE